jgi:hypothetical protein
VRTFASRSWNDPDPRYNLGDDRFIWPADDEKVRVQTFWTAFIAWEVKLRDLCEELQTTASS